MRPVSRAPTPAKYWLLLLSAGITGAAHASGAHPVSQKGGPSQNALAFDGTNDHVTLSFPAVLGSPETSDFTLHAWVRPSEQRTQRVLFAQQDATNFVSILLSATSRVFAFVSIDGAMSSSGNGATALPLGQWSHVAVVWEAAAGVPVIYVNGVPESTTPGGSSSVGTDNRMTLGARSDGGQTFAGDLDSIALFGSAHSAAQIAAAARRCFDLGGAAHLYEFDQGVAGGDNSGVTTLNDGTGTNPGALQNFALAGAGSNWVASTVLPSQSATIVRTPSQPAPAVVLERSFTAVAQFVLSAAPVSGVSVSFGVSDPSEGAMSPAEMLFTPQNWDQPQSLTFLGVDDQLLDGDIAWQQDSMTITTTDSCFAVVAALAPIDAETLDDDVDLSVSLLGDASQYARGNPVSYAVQVHSDAAGVDAAQVRVSVAATPALVDTAWTCSAQGGATCPPDGTDTLARDFALPAGGSLDFVLTGTLSQTDTPGATALQTSATLEVLSAENDIDAQNDSAQDTATLLEIDLFGDGFEPAPPP